MKDLGLSFRGRASWPVFKRQVPGFFPWLLDDHDLDIRLLPAPIREKHAKPYFPYMLLAADVSSGMILGFETIPPLPDLKTMRQNLPQLVVNFFLKNNLLPARMHYRPSLSMDYLIPFLEALQIHPEKKNKLKHIDEAWKMMLQTL